MPQGTPALRRDGFPGSARGLPVRGPRLPPSPHPRRRARRPSRTPRDSGDHPLRSLSLLSVAALFAGLLVSGPSSGCTFFRLARSEKLKVPEVTYLRTEIRSVSSDRALVDFVINARNPNKIGLRNVSVDYELFHEGRMFLKGDGLDVELAPAGDTEIRIPAVVAYDRVFTTSYALAQRVIAGDSTVPVRIDAVVSGKPTLYNETESGSLFSFTKAVSRVVDVPIPRKRIDEAADEAKERGLRELRKRF